MRIDRDSRVPLYFQLKGVLEQQIRDGMWALHERIPTENELMNQYQVSRTTVRLALTALVNEGLLRRQQGKGTFVARSRIAQSLDSLAGFVEILEQQGLKPRIEVLAIGREEASPEVQRHLDLSVDSNVVVVERRVSVNGGPLFWSRTYLPADLGAVPRREELRTQTLFHWLETVGYKPAEAWQTMAARAATRQEAARLGLKQGAPVMVIGRTAYAAGGRPLEHSRAVYRSDRYEYQIRLHREPLR